VPQYVPLQAKLRQSIDVHRWRCEVTQMQRTSHSSNNDDSWQDNQPNIVWMMARQEQTDVFLSLVTPEL
jgi:hypothetical protein